MKQHSFVIDDVKYVSGLFWQPLAAHGHAEAKKEIKLLAEELSLDLFVLRETSTKYVGLAASDEDVKSGILSVAAIVSKTLELESGARDFIFVSPAGDGGWIYVIQRDGVILPDGDQYFFDEESAKNRLYEDMSLGEWSLVIAPESWRISQSVDRDFTLLLPVTGEGKKQIYKWWRLKPVNSHAVLVENKKYIILVCICIVFLFGGKFIYKYWQDHKVEKQVDIKAYIPPPPPPPEHPWKSMPLAVDQVKACMSTLETLNLFPGNWDLSAINCANGTLTISWRPQKYGWIEHIKSVIPRAAISPDGSIASLTVPLTSLAIGKDEPVDQLEDKLLYLHSAAHKFGIKFSTSVIKTPPPPPNPNGEVPPPDWKEVSWKAESVLMPLNIIESMSGNGFRVNSMTAVWSNGQILWTMEGIQYVKN